MDAKFIVSVGGGFLLGLVIGKWALPAAGLRVEAAARPMVLSPVSPEEGYWGWGQTKPVPPARTPEEAMGLLPSAAIFGNQVGLVETPEYHAAKPPAALTEIGRRRLAGAETPSGEALGGF